jgi:hypothetical protein
MVWRSEEGKAVEGGRSGVGRKCKLRKRVIGVEIGSRVVELRWLGSEIEIGSLGC